VANYYNSLKTAKYAEDTFTVVSSPTYALSATVGGKDASRIVSVGGNLDITVKASCSTGGSSGGMVSDTNSTSNGLGVNVKLYRYQSGSITSSGTYTLVGTDTVFTSAVAALSSNANGVNWKPVIRENAAPGTYRLEFTYGDKTDYLDFIVQ
jgi:hypothetical protein